MKNLEKIAFGGGCHWCTEAVFQSLHGVEGVDQGWAASAGHHSAFSEAVLVAFDPDRISRLQLAAVHVFTHSSTSGHSMRSKYRSAIYFTEEHQAEPLQNALNTLQKDFDQPLVTEVLPLEDFRSNVIEYQNYYLKNTEKPFCQTYIRPKIEDVRRMFPEVFRDPVEGPASLEGVLT